MLTEDGVIKNRADAERVGRAAVALAWVLRTDPRVVATFHVWLRLAAIAGLVRERDLRALRALCAEDLGLSYSWLPELLYAEFGAMAVTIATGTPHTLDGRWPELGLPPGRQPKGGWSQMVRDVEWFYRATVKDPPESIRALAREYETVAGRYTDARSVVQAGIARVAKALAGLDTI